MAVGADRNQRLRTVERAWLTCGTNALLRNLPAEYLAECRYAFYCGAKQAIELLDDGDRSMKSICAEIDAYFAAVGEPRRIRRAK